MKHIYKQAQNRLMGGIDLILPPRCPVTGDIVGVQGMVSPKAWSKLNLIAEPLCAHCGMPLDFEVVGNEKCVSCLNNPPIFNSARSAFKYGDISRELILGFKHGDKTHFVSSFIPFLKQAGKAMLERADYLVPVPLHQLRFISRRYNQAALISRALSKSTNIKHLPLALMRTRPTPSQGHLSNYERAKNVKKAFDVNHRYKSILQGKSVILVDDVYTTGATVKECSKTLFKSGVKEVNVLTVARVVIK